MSVDLYVKLRDHHQAVADAYNEELEKHRPPETAEKPTETQFNSLQWTTKEGTKGNYQQTEDDSSEDFSNLSDYIKAHQGFCKLYGWKVWLHNNNPDIIDRRR